MPNAILDHYKFYLRILRLPAGVALEEIDTRFRALARKHHPDINPTSPEAEENTRLLLEARNFLRQHALTGQAWSRTHDGLTWEWSRAPYKELPGLADIRAEHQRWLDERKRAEREREERIAREAARQEELRKAAEQRLREKQAKERMEAAAAAAFATAKTWADIKPATAAASKASHFEDIKVSQASERETATEPKRKPAKTRKPFVRPSFAAAARSAASRLRAPRFVSFSAIRSVSGSALRALSPAVTLRGHAVATLLVLFAIGAILYKSPAPKIKSAGDFGKKASSAVRVKKPAKAAQFTEPTKSSQQTEATEALPPRAGADEETRLRAAARGTIAKNWGLVANCLGNIPTKRAYRGSATYRVTIKKQLAHEIHITKDTLGYPLAHSCVTRAIFAMDFSKVKKDTVVHFTGAFELGTGRVATR